MATYGSDSARPEGESLEVEEVRTGFIDGATFSGKPVQYAVVKGRAMFEGDICLGTVEQVEARTAEVRDAGGEIAFGVGRSGSQFRWPSATIPYEIAGAMPNQARATDAIAHWEANTHLKFPQRTAANAAQYPDYVHFREEDGCSSNVGRQGGRQDIILGPGCSTGNAIHEIGHAVGLWHEQSREDRDSFVTIHWDKILTDKIGNFNQHITDGDDLGGYDYGSIMHYPRVAFSKDGSETITPTNPASAQIGQRTALSAGDIAAVRALYPPPQTVARTYAGAWRAGSDAHYLWANVDQGSFVSKWKELAPQNLRLTDIEVDSSSGTTFWTGVWRAGSDPYYLWINANTDGFIAKWKELSAQNLRLVSIDAYPVGGETRWAAAWRGGSDAHYLWVNASLDGFIAKWKELSAQNLRLVSLDAYPVGNQVLWAGVWRGGSDAHYLWVNASLDGFIAKWKELSAQNLRLTVLKTYVSGGQRLWAGVWRAGSDPYYLWVNAGFDGFVAKWKELSAQNLRLVSLQKYNQGTVMTDVGMSGDSATGGGDLGSAAGATTDGVGGGDMNGGVSMGFPVEPGAPLGGGDLGSAEATIPGQGQGGGDIGRGSAPGEGGGSVD